MDEKEHETLEEEVNALDKKTAELTKKVDFVTFKRELNQVVEWKVNKVMIKKVWQQWQTILVIVALVTLHWLLTVQYFKRDFDNLERKVASLAVFAKNPDK